MTQPIIDPSTLTDEQREAIKDRYDYHNIPDDIITHWEDRNTNLIVRYILVELFGKDFFENNNG